ncbi:Uncharacterised protein [Yersinia enterocolitica]|nr:Uncharacterised protein [Yersinia mollaretii]CNK29267.1 Uncharacterised protein [Yersinia enterocolitica]CNK30229.1 Uncharacterised protein [Yersinia mollaretii]CQQ17623.1 Uncharacterised protein [Yersinia mollaretii]
MAYLASLGVSAAFHPFHPSLLSSPQFHIFISE